MKTKIIWVNKKRKTIQSNGAQLNFHRLQLYSLTDPVFEKADDLKIFDSQLHNFHSILARSSNNDGPPHRLFVNEPQIVSFIFYL